ncbi:uncharacterized protein BXZ73DRAFT_74807 [Epithele typhae]|uniref:uncharacterized protein n=1 Tax=Epithele typhae TaxID=378194 RepID=UPI002008A34A|nr:uncharacterized protein BXZ73DRAFT_74807 [Epithele typhae]KAH9941587.1 hypothetical protein BXZ73DRAFT_74807 [Epithele typhae]
MSYPAKRRRTATSVLSGDFDPRPTRDVLTSLLNGVPMPRPSEEEIQAKRERKKEKRERHERDRERDKAAREKEAERDKAPAKRVKTTHKSSDLPPPLPPSHASSSTDKPKAAPHAPPRTTASSFWQARPQIVIPSLQRSASFSPPPMPSSPPPTPGPSVSSRTSASSKRPYTPDDLDDLTDRAQSVENEMTAPKKERMGRGSPPPSEKLINLDAVHVLNERKTRSGKSFDAIGKGGDGWV